MSASTTVQTIARQVREQLPLERIVFLHDGPNTLHVHVKRGRRVRNTVVTYQPGCDLYSVKHHTFVGLGDVTTTEYERVYAEDLGRICLGGEQPARISA